jgi:hypothetical protein
VKALADHRRDSRVPHGAQLVAFTDAIVTGDDETLARTRSAVVDALGPAAMVDAAGVASNFERMVRIADSTGIELGAFLEEATGDARHALGLERPAGR